MIVLLNGPFGGGKSSTAEALLERVPNSRHFDPEMVGSLVWWMLPDHPGDFQDLRPWRGLFVAAAAEVVSFTGQTLIAPMSILRRDYADEITAGLRTRGVDVYRVLLHTDRETLEARIDGHDIDPDDPVRSAEAREFRRGKVDAFLEAYGAWLRNWAELVVDTTALTPGRVADRIAAGLDAAGSAVEEQADRPAR